MSIPNIGPEHPGSSGLGAVSTTRRGNPPPVYRDRPVTSDVLAASVRASVVTHRFGGVRYALSRPGGTPTAEPQAREGESDARE
ncbi:hypothetical protein [Actinoplanes sp. NPDC051851]|uniref:hypothetical protein n=1 Tax=Actinoplanes sp. NPDC051851 TaxID=3154753 RepID=UPI00341207CA